MKKSPKKTKATKTTKTTGHQDSKPFNRDHAYEVVTERFIKFIEENGVLPWRKPWMVVQPECAPMNYRSKEFYKGVNVFMTMMAGFASPYWLTFKQAAEMGGYVRKGEKATPVIKWQPPAKERLKAIDDDETLTDEEKLERKKKLFGFYKVFYVFNSEQIEGIEFPKPAEIEGRVFNPIEEAERVIEAMPNRPTIIHNEPRAFYQPFTDTVNMPLAELFESPEHYYSALFHEIAHSTGHKSRLGRLEDERNAAFGSKDYSFEELVAELSASFSLNELHIENKDTEENSAAYLAGWCKKLKEDAKILLKAMNKAIPATNYIFGRVEPKGENV